MDLQDNLISSKSRKRKGGWKAYAGSIVMHGLIVALILFMSASTTKVVAKQEPIRAYLSQGAAPPPPPPPPPPPASTAKSAGSPAPKHVTQIQLPKPVQITPLTPPTEIPKEIPIPQPVQPVQLKIEEATTALPQPMISSSSEGNGAGGDIPGAAPGGEGSAAISGSPLFPGADRIDRQGVRPRRGGYWRPHGRLQPRRIPLGPVPVHPRDRGASLRGGLRSVR